MIQFQKRIILILALSILCFISGYAGDNQAGQAGAFLMLGVGARANAMGNAYTSLSDDASAIYWNPAGLGILSRPQLMGMYSSMSMDRHHNFAAFALPLGRNFCLGIGWINFGVKDIDGRDFMGNPNGKFNDSEDAFILSLGKRIGFIYIGGSVKYLRHSLAGRAANAFGFDIGLKIKLTDFISIAATSRNIAGKLTWNTESKRKETIPHIERVGFAVSPKFAPIIFSGDMELNSVDKPLHFGVEYRILGVLAARTGYDSGDFNFGGGLRVEVGFMNIQLDYALLQDILEEGATNRISMLLEF